MRFDLQFNSKEMEEFIEQGYEDVRKALKKSIPKAGRKFLNEIAKRDRKDLGIKQKASDFKKKFYKLGRMKETGFQGSSLEQELTIFKKPSSVGDYRPKERAQGVEFNFRGKKKFIKNGFILKGAVYRRAPNSERLPIRKLKTGGVFGNYHDYKFEAVDAERYQELLIEQMRSIFDS